MNDTEIVNLYWERDEEAIAQTRIKYDAYCRRVVLNVLSDTRDVEECMADTYLAAWNSIPPQRPMLLSAYVGKIARRISLKKRRDERARKRGGGEIALALDELAQCVPEDRSIEEMLDEAALAELMDHFLSELNAEMRRVFLRRYWYLESIEEIAERFDFSQSKVKSILFRTRQKLMKRLKKERDV